MADLLINPLTKKRLESFIKRPAHALLLFGQQGSGLSTLATYTRKQFTAYSPDADALLLVEPNEKGTIAIEDIRGLAHRLKLRNSSSDDVSIVVVIESAEAMPGEAQNALLKLLEEPPHGVLFILLAHDSSKILPTISSRCVPIEVLPVSLDAAEAYFKDSSEAFVRSYRLSGGQTGLLHELAGRKDHPLVVSIEDAKRLLTSTPFDRVKLIESNYKQRPAARTIIESLLRVCTAALQSGRTTERWVENTIRCRDALQKLESNVQAKLVLDDLFLNLR